MTLHELREQKGRLVNEADEILKKANEEKRELLPEEDKKFDAIHVDIDKLSHTIEREEKQEAARASLTESTGRRSEPNAIESRTEHRSQGRVTAQDMDLALRGWLIAGSEDHEPSAEQQASARRCGFNLTSKRMVMKLPSVALRSMAPADIAAWEKRAAMGVGSTTIGGYSVQDSPMGALERALLSYGAMRSVSTVLRTDTGSDLPIPTSDDTSNKGAILSENSQVSEVDITFGQLVLQSYKYSSKSVLVSVELLQDSSVNVAEMIGTALGERIGRIQNDHFTTGTGSSQPNGIVTAGTSSSVTFTGTATVTADNLTDLIHSVDPAYRDGARFMFHDGALKMIKKVKVLQYSGDTVGVPLWIPGLTAGQPDQILGFPYTINQSMTTPATTVKSILFGQLSKYIIRDCRDITLVRLDERYADYHQVGFLAFARSDGDLLDAGTHPVKYGTQA